MHDLCYSRHLRGMHTAGYTTYPLCSSCSLPYPPCDWEPKDLVVVAAVQEELVPASSSSVDQPVSWVRSRKHNEGWEGLVCLYEVIHMCNTPFKSRLCVTCPWKECCVTLTVQVCFSSAGRRGREYLVWSWGGRVMLFSSLASHAVQAVPIFLGISGEFYEWKKWPLVLPKVSEITCSFGIGEISVAQGSGPFLPLHVDIPWPAWATLCPL